MTDLSNTSCHIYNIYSTECAITVSHFWIIIKS